MISFLASLPWLTGPLISPPGEATPYGDFLLKSYLSFDVETGLYDDRGNVSSPNPNFYSLNYQGLYFFGITPWCDVNVVPRLFYNFTSDQQSFHFGDLTVGLDVQLLAADHTPYFPGIKFAVREIFPTGNFQYLHARKSGTDQSGLGVFATQFDLVFYKLFHLSSFHWLSMTLSSAYTVNPSTSAHGFNAYGGGFGTKGTIVGGNNWKTVLGFELTLSRSWALALDTVYTYTESTQFYGMPGITFEGTFATVGSPSSEQLNLAPALEYNWGPHFGLIAGCYFSAFGKNSAQFRSAMINCNYLY